MTPATALLVLRGLDLLMLSIEAAPAIRSAFGRLSATLKIIVAEERDPTAAEINTLLALADAVHASIQGDGQ